MRGRSPIKSEQTVVVEVVADDEDAPTHYQFVVSGHRGIILDISQALDELDRKQLPYGVGRLLFVAGSP